MPLPATAQAFYFLSLTLEGIRAFGSEQTVSFVGSDGQPSAWTLLVGENGLGKTTILQSLARMSPFPAYRRGEDGNSEPEATVADRTEPELMQSENTEIVSFGKIDFGSESHLRLDAVTYGDDARPIELRYGVRFSLRNGELSDTPRVEQAAYKLPDPMPLIVGYGASRSVGRSNMQSVAQASPTTSLFSATMALYDAEEILGDLRFAELEEAQATMKASTRDAERLAAVKAAVADLLPKELGHTAQNIDVRGPRVPGRDASSSGVHLRMGNVHVRLSELSIGYQTVFAWTVDLAWRLLQAYPHAAHPLLQPAIVLVDEIDLHLHPRWQRTLRSHLVKHFPAVQFIATTHSPILVQETLADGGNVCLLERGRDDEVRIWNNPLAPTDWRLDQIATSPLFGLASSRSPLAEAFLERRRELGTGDGGLSADEEAELTRLDAKAAALPMADTPEEQAYRDDLRRMAERVLERERAGI